MTAKKTLAVLFCLFCLALGMRALSRVSAFRDGRVYFYGPDSWHHMRRIHYGAAHGFAMPDPDPLLNFPQGAYSQWGPLFDWVGILAARAFGGLDKARQEHAAAWVPAVLGALCVIPAFFLGGFLIPRSPPSPGASPPSFHASAGLWTALFLALLPGHGEYTLLGYLDHHVLESLLFSTSAVCFIQLGRAVERRRLWSALAGFSLLLIYTQHPALVIFYAGILWAVCLVDVFFRRQESDWWQPFLWAGLVAFPAAFSSLHLHEGGMEVVGKFPLALVFVHYSFFQPAGLLLFSSTLFLAAQFKRHSSWRVMDAVAAAIALVCAGAVSLPFLKGFAMLFGRHELASYTAETMPILFCSPSRGFDAVFAYSMYGWLFLAFPLWWFWQARSKGADHFLLSWTAVLFALVLCQVRFIYQFSYAFALAAASTLLWLWDRRRDRGALGWALLALFCVSFIPCVRWWGALAGGSPYKYVTISDEFYESAQWLRGHAPAVEGYDDASRKPAWSVLAQWDSGHAISYIGEKAVVADPFNHGMAVSARYYAAVDPRDAVAILDEKKVRYVFARDLSQPGWSELYADFLKLDPSHPLSHGEWWRLFQMRLLMNLPIAGPDGHPFRWGHRLAFLSSRGREAIFEYDPAPVKGFKKRSWTAAAGVLADVGGRVLTRSDVSTRARLDACWQGQGDPLAAFLSLMKADVLEGVLKIPVSAERLQAQAAAMRRQLGPAASCVEKIPGAWSVFERLCARPALLETMAEESGRASGISSEDLFFRLAQPQVRWRVYDPALESALMIRQDSFLTALDNG